MHFDSNIQSRSASIGDKEFIVSLVPRLVEFVPPSWRDADQMTATDIGVLTDKLVNQPAGDAIFIAEDARGVRLGFIHLQSGTGYYNREEHGHIGDVIVAPEGEGRGYRKSVNCNGRRMGASARFSLADIKRVCREPSSPRSLHAA